VLLTDSRSTDLYLTTQQTQDTNIHVLSNPNNQDPTP